MIEFAPVADDKYFATEKGIKLGMSYDEVIKIYGKPDRKEINKSDKTKFSCIWEIQGIFTKQYEDTPLEGARLKEAKKAKMGVETFHRKTIEFSKGKVDQINLYFYWPG